MSSTTPTRPLLTITTRWPRFMRRRVGAVSTALNARRPSFTSSFGKLHLRQLRWWMIAWQAASLHPVRDTAVQCGAPWRGPILRPATELAWSTRRGQAKGNHDGLCQAHRQDRDAGGCPRSGCGGDDHPRHLFCSARFGLLGRAFLVEGRRILHERGVPIDSWVLAIGCVLPVARIWCRRAGCGPFVLGVG